MHARPRSICSINKGADRQACRLAGWPAGFKHAGGGGAASSTQERARASRPNPNKQSRQGSKQENPSKQPCADLVRGGDPQGPPCLYGPYIVVASHPAHGEPWPSGMRAVRAVHAMAPPCAWNRRRRRRTSYIHASGGGRRWRSQPMPACTLSLRQNDSRGCEPPPPPAPSAPRASPQHG